MTQITTTSLPDLIASLGDATLSPAEQRDLIRRLAFRLRISNSALAEKAGVAASTITRFMSDDSKRLTPDTLHKIKQAAVEITADIAIGETDPNAPFSKIKHRLGDISEEIPPFIPLDADTNYFEIDVYDLAARGGPGSLEHLIEGGNPQPAYRQPFAEQFLRSITSGDPRHLIILRVEGDSMQKTLNPGDLIFVNTAVKKITRHGIYVLAIEDELMVKRIHTDRLRGKLTIISDNDEDYPAIDYTFDEISDERFRCIGHVESCIKRLS